MFKIEVNLKEMQVCLIWKKTKAYKFLCAEGVFFDEVRDKYSYVFRTDKVEVCTYFFIHYTRACSGYFICQ